MIPLSVNQKLAVKKLEELRVGALFMEPGTGKTRTAVELINSSNADWVLFLVPYQTKRNLLVELKKWKLKKKFEIEGIESLSNSDRLYLNLMSKLKKYKYPFVVCDESLKIKNINAKRTKRIIEIGKLAYYRLILNGTPISKNVLDLYPQMEFLSPKILKMKYPEFWSKFVISKTIDDGYSRKTIIKGSTNIDYLYSLISPYVFVAKLNLKINENEHEIKYICDDVWQYQQIKQEMINRLAFMGDIEFLATSQKMQQAYSLDAEHVRTCKDLVGSLKRKSIIFTKFIKTRETLQALFPACKVLTYGKGSLGLNLQNYKNVIFYDKTWDYAQLEQAKRRVYRIGQSEDVNYYFLTGNLGLEKIIDTCISGKTTLLNLFKESSMEELINEF